MALKVLRFSSCEGESHFSPTFLDSRSDVSTKSKTRHGGDAGFLMGGRKSLETILQTVVELGPLER
jgi:hypothetical protein